MVKSELEENLKLAKNKNKLVFAYVFLTILLLIILSFFLIYKDFLKNNNSGYFPNPSDLNSVDTGSVFQDMVNSENGNLSDADSSGLDSRKIGDYLIEDEVLYDERSGLENKDGVEIWYGIDIISSGSIYTENINVGEGELTRLFKLGTTLLSGEGVEVVVGVDSPEIKNWWISTAMSTSGRYTNDEIKKVREGEINIELLEDLFSESSRWRYYFYFSSDFKSPESYKEVASAYIGDYTPDYIVDKIKLGDLKDIRLFPYQIYANP